jgi:tungstate transport system permease protein
MDYLIEGLQQALMLLVTFDAETYSAIFISLKAASTSTALSIAAGVPAGFLLGYYDFAGKTILRNIVNALLALPTVVVGLMVYMFITRRGPFGEYGLLFTVPAVVIGQAVLILPIVIALTASALETLEDNFKENLISLGAGRMQCAVTALYESRYALYSAFITAFGRAFSEVGVSMTLGGNIKWETRTITTTIALQTSKGEFGLGLALGMVLISIALFLNIMTGKIRGRG